MKKNSSSFCSISDKFLFWIELLTVLTVIAGFIIPAVHYARLPQEIPVHFDMNGQPDDFRPKMLIWILPVASLLLYLLTSGLAFLPKLLHRQSPVADEKAERSYRRIRLVFGVAKWLGAGILTFITSEIIYRPEHLLDSLLIIIFVLLVLMAVSFIYYVYRRLMKPFLRS